MEHPGVGPNLAPLLLRLVLGVVFLWAGWNKVFNTMTVTGEQAAALANMGALAPATRGAPTEAPPKATPGAATPASGSRPVPTEPLPPTSMNTRDWAPLPVLMRVQDATGTPPAYTAADFPEERKVANLYGIALMLKAKAAGGVDENGKQIRPQWPSWGATGNRPVLLAWAASLTELLGAMLLLTGLLTRLAAFLAAGVMATAMWFTQFGPAISSGQTRFGVLPDRSLWEVDAAGNSVWILAMWQLCLLVMSLSVMLLGGGYLSLDRVLSRPSAPAPIAKKPPADAP